MSIPPENDPMLVSKYQPQWSRTVRVIAGVFLLVAGIYALTLLGPVIQMLIIAFLLAFVMYPPVRSLSHNRVLRWPGAVTLLYLVLILIVLGALLVLIPAFVDGATTLIAQGETAYNTMLDSLRAYVPEQGLITVLDISIDLNPLITPLRAFVLGGVVDAVTVTPEEVVEGTTEGTLEDATLATAVEADGAGEILGGVNLQQLINSVFNVASTLTGTVTSAITTAAGLIATLLLAVFISFLILLDLPHSQRQFALWVPPAYHREAALLIEKLRLVWMGFFRGQVLIGVIVGVLTWLQLTVMGVPGVLVLAIFTGFISLIPTLGGFIALIPLSLVPLLQGSTVFVDMPNGLFALLVVIVNLLISQVIWNVVAPKILGDALDLPLPVIIVGVFIGAALGGVLGAFLVAPIVSTLRVLVFYTIRKIAQEDPFPGLVPQAPLQSEPPPIVEEPPPLEPETAHV